MWYSANTLWQKTAWADSILGYSSQSHLLYYSLHISRKHQKVNMPIIHCSLSFGNCRNFSFCRRKCYCLTVCRVLVVWGSFVLFRLPAPPKRGAFAQSLRKKSWINLNFTWRGGKPFDFYRLTEVCVFIQVFYSSSFVRILPLSNWK